jgi:hypothetical protein
VAEHSQPPQPVCHDRRVTSLILDTVLAVVAVAVLFGLAVLVLPRGEQIAPPVSDHRPWAELPDEPLQAEDLVEVRLPVTLRGYRFAETDLLIDRLGDELRRRDAEIARLQGLTSAAASHDERTESMAPAPVAPAPIAPAPVAEPPR